MLSIGALTVADAKHVRVLTVACELTAGPSSGIFVQHVTVARFEVRAYLADGTRAIVAISDTEDRAMALLREYSATLALIKVGPRHFARGDDVLSVAIVARQDSGGYSCNSSDDMSKWDVIMRFRSLIEHVELRVGHTATFELAEALVAECRVAMTTPTGAVAAAGSPREE